MPARPMRGTAERWELLSSRTAGDHFCWTGMVLLLTLAGNNHRSLETPRSDRLTIDRAGGKRTRRTAGRAWAAAASLRVSIRDSTAGHARTPVCARRRRPDPA